MKLINGADIFRLGEAMAELKSIGNPNLIRWHPCVEGKEIPVGILLWTIRKRDGTCRVALFDAANKWIGVEKLAWAYVPSPYEKAREAGGV